MMFSDTKKFANIVMNDMTQYKNTHTLLKKYDKETIQRFLENPETAEKQLRNISNILYNKSSHYKRLILYFANMLTFSYIVEPYGFNPEDIDLKKFQNQYHNVLNMIEKMNVKHEFTKIMKVIFTQDIFYGYEFEAKESYYIQRLKPEHCRISTIEDGCYNFEFNMAYFDRDKNKLKEYPEEFNRKYARYKETNNPWQELDSENTICIKVNEETEIPIPPFSGIFEEVFDLAEYKNLRKTKEKMDIFKVLAQKLPMKKDSNEINDFLIDFDTMMNFHNKASESLPDEVGLITSPMEIASIDVSNKKNDIDNVAKTERDYWSSAGVSQSLFHSEKSSNNALTKSIQTDEQIVYAILRQFERWLNRKIKKELKTYKYFKVKFLDITVFNSKEVFENNLKAAQFGFPTAMTAASALGLSPSSVSNMEFLENDVLGIKDKFIPLRSSHTGSDSGESGNQTKDEDELSEEGEKTRDGEKNDTVQGVE